jgi:hypothetical protein
MKFSILVNEGPYTHEASDTAFQFVKAALAKGHEIYPRSTSSIWWCASPRRSGAA